MIIRKATVLKQLSTHPHQLLHCQIIAQPASTVNSPEPMFQIGTRCNAINYPELLGTAETGDTLQIELSPLAKSLGTGGNAMVIANETKLPDDSLPDPGHLMKARYTPNQIMILGADEPDSPYYTSLQNTEKLDTMPVMVADLHSALPAIIAGYLENNTSAKLVYIQTDGAALPISYSRTVNELKSEGTLFATITCGQSYGGDYETVTLASALQIAKCIEADAVIISQGPGNLGTGSTWGFSGLSVSEHIRTAHYLKATPIAVIRMSNADPRDRHYGISHHTLTTLLKTELPQTDVPLPVFNSNVPQEQELSNPKSKFATVVNLQTEKLRRQHRIHQINTGNLYKTLQEFPIKLSTMGRGLPQDPASFLAAAVAGRYAAQLKKEQTL